MRVLTFSASFGLPKREKIVAEICLAESPASSI